MKVRLKTLCGCSREIEVAGAREFIEMPLVPHSIPFQDLDASPYAPTFKIRTFKYTGCKNGMHEFTEIEPCVVT